MKYNWFLKYLLPLMAFGQFSVTGDEDGGAKDEETSGDEDAGEGDKSVEGDKEADKADESEKPKVTDAEAKLLKEVMDKKKALKKIQDEKLAVDAQLKQFEGIDPVKVRELLKKQAEQETKELEAQGNWDRLKANMAEQHTKDMSELQAKLDAALDFNSNSSKTISELTVGQTFATSDFIAKELALTVNKARVVYGSHFEHQDGKVVAYDKPAGTAERTMLVDASGDPMTFDAALRKIVDADPDRDELLLSKKKQGASSSTTAKGKTVDPVVTTELKGRSRIAEALKTIEIK